jgi:hypothetical protein
LKAILAIVAVLGFAVSTEAHRLDEYLQAARLAISPKQIDLALDLTPGVAIVKELLPLIDVDRNGRISQREKAGYAQRILKDLQLEIDGRRQPIKLVRATFPSLEEMEAGEGVIRLTAVAKIPRLRPGEHELGFQNDHLPAISVYLANALVPKTKTVVIKAQLRNPAQREYHLHFDVMPAAKKD